MGKGDTPPVKLTIFGLSADEDKAAQIEQKIAGGETSMVEFKSTLRWHIRANRVDKKMEEIILKSIAALSNRYGGTLFIGVRDDGEVLGLDADYATLKEPNKDHFELHLRELVNAAYGTNFATSQLEITFPEKDGKAFCQIEVKHGKEPLYTQVSGNDKNAPKTEKFYVRSGNSSRELPIDEIPKYVGERFKQPA